MLTFWIRPAAAALFWIAVVASTLAELTTVGPSLRAATCRGAPVSYGRAGALDGGTRWLVACSKA